MVVWRCDIGVPIPLLMWFVCTVRTLFNSPWFSFGRPVLRFKGTLVDGGSAALFFDIRFKYFERSSSERAQKETTAPESFLIKTRKGKTCGAV